MLLQEHNGKEAIHDRAVLGFQVEDKTTMPGWDEDEIEDEFLCMTSVICYQSWIHTKQMSKRKLGFQKWCWKTYEVC